MRTESGRRVAVGLVLLLAAALMAGCGSDDQQASKADSSHHAPAQTGAAPVARLTRLAKFANTLTALLSSKDGSELLVGDRLGQIWRLDQTDPNDPGAAKSVAKASNPDTGTPKLFPVPILDLTDRVSSSPGERGFFGMAMAPDGRSIVVDYTATDGTVTVQQYPYEPGQPIDPKASRTLMALDDPYSWHHGGGLAFDRKGNLLVGVGDLEFRQINPPGPQDPRLMIGGILRIPAEVVNDRSLTSKPAPTDMVARGMRNPWRLSVNPKTGDLWVGDVGLDTYEEIDTIPEVDLDGTTVTNFGWPYREGPGEQQKGAPADAAFSEPVLSRRHGKGVCGMVGGYWYRGTAIPALRGTYVYGDLCGYELRAMTLTPQGKVASDRAVATLDETIVSLGQTAGGEIYALGSAGGLYRVDPKRGRPSSSDQQPPTQLTTTTIERSRSNCENGVVAAMLPLSRISEMDGAELTAALDKANKRLAVIVPTLPDYIRDDATVVQNLLLELTARVAADHGNKAEAMNPLRADFEAGRGPFAAFPDAMAKVVDSECG